MSHMAEVKSAGFKVFQTYDDIPDLRKAVEDIVPLEEKGQWSTPRKGVMNYRVGTRVWTVVLGVSNPLPREALPRGYVPDAP